MSKESTAPGQPATTEETRHEHVLAERADDVLSAITARKQKPYTIYVSGKAIQVTLQALSWKDLMAYQREAALQQGNNGSMSKPELLWIRYGVVDKKGQPLFTPQHIKQLEDADAAITSELIRAIKAISGHAPDVEWDKIYERILDSSVQELYNGVTSFMRPLIDGEYEEEFDKMMEEFRDSAMRLVLKSAMENASMVGVEKFKWGDVGNDALTDDQLGNFFEQTPRPSESGKSASSNSDDSPASS
jgi:hypothetical protein